MKIERNAYLQQLIQKENNGMIKVITGIRRCGKSYLLFDIFKAYLMKNGVKEDHINCPGRHRKRRTQRPKSVLSVCQRCGKGW